MMLQISYKKLLRTASVALVFAVAGNSTAIAMGDDYADPNDMEGQLVFALKLHEGSMPAQQPERGAEPPAADPEPQDVAKPGAQPIVSESGFPEDSWEDLMFYARNPRWKAPIDFLVLPLYPHDRDLAIAEAKKRKATIQREKAEADAIHAKKAAENERKKAQRKVKKTEQKKAAAVAKSAQDQAIKEMLDKIKSDLQIPPLEGMDFDEVRALVRGIVSIADHDEGKGQRFIKSHLKILQEKLSQRQMRKALGKIASANRAAMLKKEGDHPAAAAAAADDREQKS